MTFKGYRFDVGNKQSTQGVKRGGKQGGDRLMLEGAQQSSRAERGEEGLEVGKPGGQTASQPGGREKESGTESKHRSRRTSRQTIMQIHKTQHK